jgi:replicative DNA helicase
LKQLAGELDVPILAMSQLNRQPEGRTDGKLKLSDLRESGSIEQDANAVWLIHMPGQHSKEADPALCELMIGKNRKGPRAVINLHWAADYTRFDNWRADGD